MPAEPGPVARRTTVAHQTAQPAALSVQPQRVVGHANGKLVGTFGIACIVKCTIIDFSPFLLDAYENPAAATSADTLPTKYTMVPAQARRMRTAGAGAGIGARQ